jgi:hypothetical protein
MRSHADALQEVIRPRESVVMMASSEVCASSHLISLIDPKHLSVRSLFDLTFAKATPFEKTDLVRDSAGRHVLLLPLPWV